MQNAQDYSLEGQVEGRQGEHKKATYQIVKVLPGPVLIPMKIQPSSLTNSQDLSIPKFIVGVLILKM